MSTHDNEKMSSIQPTLVSFSEEEVQAIAQHWIRMSDIKVGWIRDFNKLVVKYVMFLGFFPFNNKYIFIATPFLMFDTFHSSSKLLKSFTGHTYYVYSIDYSTLDGRNLLCSGSYDKRVCVWDVDAVKKIGSFNGHLDWVSCVKFSPYHYYNACRSVVCSSSNDKTIRFWDIKDNQPFQIFNEHNRGVCGITFSPFNGGRYLCSGSFDNTIRLWDVETSKSVHVFNGHTNGIWCVNMSPVQSNNNSDESKSDGIGVIGGNGYTICSGSFDRTIAIWDIETAQQSIVFKGHTGTVHSIKYGSNGLGNTGGSNTILSGAQDHSVRLWDIRSGEQLQVFDGHKSIVWAVEYSPFVLNNIDVGGNSNVICSGSFDNTVRFWDIRSNKKELFVIKGNDEEDKGIFCLAFASLRKKGKKQYTKNQIMIVVLIYVMVQGKAQFVFGDKCM
ncbi:WD-repeat protein [Reticulomyxa filosa]|uniref:WD-repeat protein n=1 Tax=Reticulomyxa filosa TaxID=46433 RepID=X6P697_RETFI|nr:WD-repeat protein [Reticulomyxa filosa]|eukprot:ETO33638.1 WD-repeat protein [Reticulomyxa filosa]